MTGWRAEAEDVASAIVATSQGGVEGGITVSGGGASSVQTPLTVDEKKEKKRIQDKTRESPSGKNHTKNKYRVEDSADNRARCARQLQSISKL